MNDAALQVKGDTAPGSTRGVAMLTLVLLGLVAPGVPPSVPKGGLSGVELALEHGIVPLLGLALLLAGWGAVVSWRGAPNTPRWLALTSLLFANLAGTLASLFGVDTLGLAGTLVVTVVVVAHIFVSMRRPAPR
jgi:hypothetical protein